ncbi:MAG: energy transducer TonB [Urechidicola sp.]|nr:energy transducer TonB [Urechidicola sp.]
MEIKKSPKADLEGYTRIFFQLGLVLSLLTVYLAIEHKTYERVSQGLEVVSSEHELEEEVEDFEIEVITTPPPPPPPAPEVIEIVEDEEEVEETIIESTETDENESVEVEEIIEVEEEEDFDEDVPFAIIEDVPVYPGCEKEKGKKAKKDCLNRSLNKFIGRKFNADLASDLGLPPGKQKIYIQFRITKTGGIEILGARAPHKRLEKEAKRVVNMLPKMTPGKQRGRPVNVTYMLPISFNVE